MKVTTSLVFKILNWLDIKYKNSDNDYIELNTICHHGDSNKLFFYKNTNIFMCYTNCGKLDVFELIAKVKNISKAAAFKTVINNFNVDSSNISNNIVFNPATKFSIHKKQDNELHKIDDSILKTFYPLGIEDWKKERIDYKTQRKFEIMFSIEQNAIIIPHRDFNGNLVGIRQRNLHEHLVENGIKYVPTKVNGKQFNYPTGKNLYGYFYNREVIEKTKKIVLFEAEKSVLMMDSYFDGNNFSVALSGHYLSSTQINFLMKLNVDEIIFALDKDFKQDDIVTIKAMQKMMLKRYSILTNRFNVSVIWDDNNVLDYKDSPTDKGKEVFQKLFKERKYM